MFFKIGVFDEYPAIFTEKYVLKPLFHKLAGFCNFFATKETSPQVFS